MRMGYGRAPATAKLNLALVVGGPRDGKHELTTVYQRLDLADRIALAPEEFVALAHALE